MFVNVKRASLVSKSVKSFAAMGLERMSGGRTMNRFGSKIKSKKMSKRETQKVD
jgi:hypothetical protein